MAIEIKNTSGIVIYTVDGDSLTGANLSRADLRGANMSGADLSGADLSGAYLRGANLSGADLRGANLSGAYLRGAYLSGADLSVANLREADLRGANLKEAYLSGADLSGANLREADLMDVVGNMRELKSMQIDRYSVAWTAYRLQIGCKQYKINDWFDFCDDAIANMDDSALEWWSKYKDFIRTAIDLSPATPTGHENA